MTDGAWWRCWEPGQEAELGRAEFDGARAHPRFHEALRHSLTASLRMVDREEEFQRLIIDLPAFLIAVVALYLDATGGLTHRRLRDLAGIKGFLSGGRVSVLLLRMQMIGYVHAVSSSAPGVPKLYRPTAKMAAVLKARIRVELEAVVLMAPELAGLLETYDRTDGLAAFMRVLGESAVASARRPSSLLPGLVEIGNRRAGTALLMALLEASAEAAGGPPCPGPLEVSISALARRFRVSRTHVLKVLIDAERHGYFTRDADGRSVVEPALVEDMETYYAGIYIGMAVCMDRSLRSAPDAAAFG